MATRKKILVTGGHGFLGQHIVHLLRCLRSECCAVRVLDVRREAFGTPLSPEPPADAPPVEVVVADLLDYPAVLAAFSGVDLVIHSAALVDFWKRTHNELLAVNTQGTYNVVRACMEAKVPHLIYTSTMAVSVPIEGLAGGTEEDPYPFALGKPFLYGAYGETKALAEQCVLAANGVGGLTTVVLRALCMYGENDPWQIPNLVGSAVMGYVFRIGNRGARCQSGYVRNVAWAHVVAADQLVLRPSAPATTSYPPKIAGRVYIPGDGTPIRNYFDTNEPLLAAAGCTTVSWWLPYTLGWLSAFLIEALLWMLKPLVEIHTSFNLIACKVVSFSFWFHNSRATKELGYRPLYSYSEALARTTAHIQQYRKWYGGRVLFLRPTKLRVGQR
eukprot:RCo026602